MWLWWLLLGAALVYLWQWGERNRTTVYVELQGRLGNQLFQLATAEAHRRRQGLGQVCAVGTLHPALKAHWPGPLTVASIAPSVPCWHEPTFAFGRLPPVHVRRLRGYFQAPAYFADVLPPAWFTAWLKPPAVPAWLPSRHNERVRVIGVHVRRGDYVRLSQVHTPLEWDYYQRAWQHLSTKLKHNELHVAVFSDDIEWVQRTWGTRMQQHWSCSLHWVSTGDDWTQLTWLSRCHHHIIANSSFSWWGAFAHAQPGCVVAPKRWFGPAGPDDWQSLYPAWWTLV